MTTSPGYTPPDVLQVADTIRHFIVRQYLPGESPVQPPQRHTAAFERHPGFAGDAWPYQLPGGGVPASRSRPTRPTSTTSIASRTSPRSSSGSWPACSHAMTTSEAATLVDYLEASAARFPDRTAIVDPAGWSLTYARARRARRSDRGLPGRQRRATRRSGWCDCAQGRRRHHRVHRHHEGARRLRAGGLYARRRREIARFWPTAQVKAAFLAPACASIARRMARRQRDAVGGRVPRTTSLPATEAAIESFAWNEAIAHAPVRVDGRRSSDLAYILYTSGSTGVPKGVMLTTRTRWPSSTGARTSSRPTETDRFSSHAPFHFDLSVLDIYVPLKHGASDLHHLGRAREVAQGAGEVHRETPADGLVLDAVHSRPPGRVRRPGVARLPRAAARPVRGRSVPGQASARSDATLAAGRRTTTSTGPPRRTSARSRGFRCRFRTIARRRIRLAGRARTATRRCSTTRRDAEVAPGTGRAALYRRTVASSSATGTGPSRTPGPFSSATADVGTTPATSSGSIRAEGFIYLGRRDRMVKRRGYRIELGEIERGCISTAPFSRPASLVCPMTRAACASSRTSRRARPRTAVDHRDEDRSAPAHLPSYMSPDVFLFLDALPRTSTDKIDYQVWRASPKPAGMPSKADSQCR